MDLILIQVFFYTMENLVEEMMKYDTFVLVANRYHNLLLNNNNILNLILFFFLNDLKYVLYQ